MNDNQIKLDLVYAYKIISYLQMDDLTYTHITARPDGENYFYILAFGNMFYEASEDKLVKVDFDGNILAGNEKIYNQTGYVIHSSIYKSRKDINAIYHLHTLDSISVSVMQCGLLPISQFAMPFFENISYHDYNSLALDQSEHGNALSKDLGNNNKNMLLKSHGTINCGRNLQEGLFFTRFLHQACKIQVKVLSSNQKYYSPSRENCIRAREDMLNFESNLGSRDWNALIRKLSKT
jgi:ribulose-5-phosphate 4-epimerase/fuculose-1-phosphate aldolase